MSDRLTQCRKILGHIRLNGSITPLEALDLFGCFRLGARIWDLNRSFEENGSPERIDGDMESNNGKRYKRYFLAVETSGQARMAI